MEKREITEFWVPKQPSGSQPKHLTARQMRKVRGLAHAALAERGIEASIHADHLSTIDGRVFGLENLASKCLTSGLAEAEWNLVVGGHFEGLFTAFPHDAPPRLTAEQLRAGTYLRLGLEEAVSRLDGHQYVRRLGGGLVEILAHRDGDIVRWLNDEEVALVGLDELRAIGRANLLRVEPDQHDAFCRGPIKFHIVRGESGFIASKLLVLPDLMREVLGTDGPYPDGVLVAVPTRYEIAFAPVEEWVAGPMGGLWSFSGWAFSHGTGPLSPYFYWWRDGELTQLSYYDSTGEGRIHRNPEFEALVERLTPGGWPFAA